MAKLPYQVQGEQLLIIDNGESIVGPSTGGASDPLKLQLILNKIFVQLSTTDLFNCRRVCRTWNTTILSILRKQGQLIKLNKKNLPNIIKYLSAQVEPSAGLFYYLEACTCDLIPKIISQLIHLTVLIGPNVIQIFKYTWHSDEDVAESPQLLFYNLIKVLKLISPGLVEFIILPQIPRPLSSSDANLQLSRTSEREEEEFSFSVLSRIQFGIKFDTNLYNSRDGGGGDWASCANLLTWLLNTSPGLKSLELQDLTILHLAPSARAREQQVSKYNPALAAQDQAKLTSIGNTKYLSTISHLTLDLSHDSIRQIASNAFQFQGLTSLTIISYELEYLNINNFILHNRHSLSNLKFSFGKFRPAEAKEFFQSLPPSSKLQSIELDVLISSCDPESLNVLGFTEEFMKRWPRLEVIKWSLDFDMVAANASSSVVGNAYRVKFEMEMKRDWKRLNITFNRLWERIRGGAVLLEPSAELFRTYFGQLEQVMIQNQCILSSSSARSISIYNNTDPNEEFLEKFVRGFLEGITGIICLELGDFRPYFLNDILGGQRVTANLQCLRHLTSKERQQQTSSKEIPTTTSRKSPCLQCESMTDFDFDELELLVLCNKNKRKSDSTAEILKNFQNIKTLEIV